MIIQSKADYYDYITFYKYQGLTFGQRLHVILGESPGRCF